VTEQQLLDLAAFETSSAFTEVERSKPEGRPCTEPPRPVSCGYRWHTAWGPFFELVPAWTEAFFASCAPGYIGNVVSPELVEELRRLGARPAD
jgi:hypothetical protein